jgi:hypothetical protein
LAYHKRTGKTSFHKKGFSDGGIAFFNQTLFFLSAEKAGTLLQPAFRFL